MNEFENSNNNISVCIRQIDNKDATFGIKLYDWK